MHRDAKSGNRRATWSVTSYIEAVKATSKVRNVDQGKMLWKDADIEYWQTVDGGSLRKNAAENEDANMKLSINPKP